MGDAFGGSRRGDKRRPWFAEFKWDDPPDDHMLSVEGEAFLWRYYGDGYERGPLPMILAVCRFVRDLTGGTVWYGSDCGGWREVTDDYMEELWAHFVMEGHAPYLRASSDHPCPECNGPTWKSGFGPWGDSWSCSGCGWTNVPKGEGILG
jgi:hypothetical protein